MKKQQYSSAETSINSKKLPAIYRRARKIGLILPGTCVLDYGCGKHTALIREYAAREGFSWHGYDPYNLPDSVPVTAPVVLCSNVLNVIAEDEIVDDVIRQCVAYAQVAAVFTIYDGDRSGVGRQTGKDQYQRNERMRAYKARIEALGYDVVSKAGMLIVRV